jgi:putative PIN family toxin of toxin-antitoxin system
VVIDTNVAVSGLLFGGLPARVIDLALARRFIWCSSPSLKEEMDRVLSKKKFGLSQAEFYALTTPVYDVIEWHSPAASINVIVRCPADNRVLECALESKSRYIVTGDRRDLVSLKEFSGVAIVQPREFLSLIVA